MINLFKRRYQPLITTKIPHKAEFQLRTETLGHKINENWRLLRRELFLITSGQKFLEREIIPIQAKRILWLAPSIKNIGDAVMALSGRKLLSQARYTVDIVLDKKVFPLFKQDGCFHQVFDDPEKIEEPGYDLIILDSVKSVSLKMKKRYFKKTPYCHFRGHFDGVEFNWTLFSYHRINALLNDIYTQEQVDSIAVPLLYPVVVEKNKSKLIIAIGGEDQARRVYNKWDEVIQELNLQIPNLEIILVGNINAVEDAQMLAEQFGNNVTNLVNQLGLADTAMLINQAAYFIGCDGGLMHIAAAYNLEGVALFGYFEPVYRLPLVTGIHSVYDKVSVKNLLAKNLAGELIDIIVAGNKK